MTDTRTVKLDQSNRYHTKVRTWDAAVELAAAKEKLNGAFEEVEGGYVVSWDADPKPTIFNRLRDEVGSELADEAEQMMEDYLNANPDVAF